MKKIGLAMTLAALSVAAAQPAAAAVTVFTTQAAFSAATAVTNTETFESYTVTNTNLATLPVHNGIEFTLLPGTTRYLIARAGFPFFNPAPTSQVLTSSDDENFGIKLDNGSLFNAIGFNVITNRFNAPVVSLYDAAGRLINATTLTQGRNAYGFFGVTSTVGIAYATFTGDRGGIENTGLDNVQINAIPAAAGVPEPASWALMIMGFGAAGAMLRRRRAASLGV